LKYIEKKKSKKNRVISFCCFERPKEKKKKKKKKKKKLLGKGSRTGHWYLTLGTVVVVVGVVVNRFCLKLFPALEQTHFART